MQALVTQDEMGPPPATCHKHLEGPKKRREKNYRHGRLITVARNFRHEEEAGSARRGEKWVRGVGRLSRPERLVQGILQRISIMLALGTFNFGACAVIRRCCHAADISAK